MSGDDEVKLLGYWGSPYTLRIKWALNLKGITYDYVEENLPNKSQMLLEYNPVYKKIPVLVHNNKPMAESLVILEYIDETWKHNPLLPEDPHERAKARFWAKFADGKCVPAIFETFFNTGEEKEKAAKETRENLKMLETGLEGKQPFFGGEKIGYLDVAVAWLGIWAWIVEEIADAKLLDDGNTPLLNAWFRDICEVPEIKECIPPLDKLLAHNRDFHDQLVASKTTDV